MAQFLKGNELNSGIGKIFEDSQKEIILVSPYIKLHERYKELLLDKKREPSIKITVLFGKNEDNISKSIKKEDFDFFKQFPNIQINYEKRLHAKYYANESKSILSSMNLYGYSQNNNIEAGILIKRGSRSDTEIDSKSCDYFSSVIEKSELLFLKEAFFEKKNMFSSSNYIKSEIKIDSLSEFFEMNEKKTLKKESLEYKSNTNIINNGYCIRTGEKIPFSVERPLSKDSFKKWYIYKDKTYTEKYCHYSGEKSEGKTTFEKPILGKNWKRAKETHNF